ncbi:hypothetical protein [Allosaccharopolyspora coralli]|uniref:hypothetical protein n=1 Tax=Allosaccharopolyspora coralli TaxID=2665642 RepID=UPI001E4FBE14|nr:hypothetical protein [Allosaccharopolyspora coralli]
MSMSLDGFTAPESTDVRESLKLGEEGRDNDIARETFERTGASVMGKRMFELASSPGRRSRRSTRGCPS